MYVVINQLKFWENNRITLDNSVNCSLNKDQCALESEEYSLFIWFNWSTNIVLGHIESTQSKSFNSKVYMLCCIDVKRQSNIKIHDWAKCNFSGRCGSLMSWINRIGIVMNNPLCENLYLDSCLFLLGVPIKSCARKWLDIQWNISVAVVEENFRNNSEQKSCSEFNTKSLSNQMMINRNLKKLCLYNCFDNLINWEWRENKLKIILVQLESHWRWRRCKLAALWLEVDSTISEYIHSLVEINWRLR